MRPAAARVSAVLGRCAALELWLYRLLLVVGVLAWWAARHPQTWARLQQHWAVCLLGLVPLVFAMAYAWVRRRWLSGVVAVSLGLALTVAIIFPVFATVGCDHRMSSCFSNLKQIGLACLQHAQDHEQRLPPAEQSWTAALEAYLHRVDVFHCSEDAQPVSYAINPYLRGRKLSELPAPAADVILVYESDGIGLVARHNDGYHIAFADGHVKWFPAGAEPVIWNPWEPKP